MKLNRGNLLQRKFSPILVKLNGSMRDGFIRLDADRIEAVSVLRIRRVIKRFFDFSGKILAYLHGNWHLHLSIVQDCRAFKAPPVLFIQTYTILSYSSPSIRMSAVKCLFGSL